MPGANAAIGILNGLRFRLKLEGGAELQSVLARGCVQGWGLMGSNAVRFGHGDDQQRIHAGARAEAVVPASEIAERMGAKLGEAIANFFGERAEISDDHFRLAVEFGAELFVLRGDADGAGVEMALAGHDAADGEERGGAETEFVGAEESANDDVARKFQAAVDAKRDARTEACANERVVRFAKADFPGQTRVFDGGERRRAGAAVVAADGDDVGARFGDACGDDADTCAADEFDADARAGIDGAQDRG